MMGRIARRNTEGARFQLQRKTNWMPPEGGYEKASEGIYFPGKVNGAFGGTPIGLSAFESIEKQTFDVLDCKLGVACGSVDGAITNEINRAACWISNFVDWLLFWPGKPKAKAEGIYGSRAPTNSSAEMTFKSLGWKR